MALRPVLLRYLVHLPDLSEVDDPRPVRALNLSPAIEHGIANSVLAALVIIFLWWSRKPVMMRDSPEVLWECGALGILMVLFSPITWGQHCVALLPVCFLIAALLVVRDHCPRWMILLLLVYVLFCVLAGRDLVGKRLGVLLVSYHVSTFCILGLFAIALAGPRLQRSTEK